MWTLIKTYDKHLSVKWPQRYDHFPSVYPALFIIGIGQNLQCVQREKDHTSGNNGDREICLTFL